VRGDRRLSPRQREHGRIGGQEQGHAAAAGQEGNLAIRLSLVGFEDHWLLRELLGEGGLHRAWGWVWVHGRVGNKGRGGRGARGAEAFQPFEMA
jgi:hypothetical protein